MKHLTIISALLLAALITVPNPARAHADVQSPAPDSYEPNDSLAEAQVIPRNSTLQLLTIAPSGDHDYFQLLAVPGPLRVEAVGSPGFDLTIEIIRGAQEVVAADNDPGGPGASVQYPMDAEEFVVIHVLSTTPGTGVYELRVTNSAPPTPTVVPTGTPAPTSPALPTPLPPTITATADLGGAPDYAEPNWDFDVAYRIGVGTPLEGLNFSAGSRAQVDNDFYVLAVRAGVRYTCETRDLSGGVDTNLILYGPDRAIIDGNDDIDPAAGLINSRVTFTPVIDSDLYILVGYKGGDLRYPGTATYTLSCGVDLPPTPAPVTGGNTGPMPTATPDHLIYTFTLVDQPAITPSPTPQVPEVFRVRVLVGYDENDNGVLDLPEGVRELSVRVVDAGTNRELAHGFTDTQGAAAFTVQSMHGIRVLIPFLSAARELRAGQETVTWELLIPPGTQPGLIP